MLAILANISQDLVFSLTPNFSVFRVFLKLSLAGTLAQWWSTCVVCFLLVLRQGHRYLAGLEGTVTESDLELFFLPLPANWRVARCLIRVGSVGT